MTCILYIDDDPGLGRLVEKDLTRHGYEVVLAESGEAGLKALYERRFDAVALDHYMPGRDGLDVLVDIRACPDAPPVVFVTGTDESRVAIAALKAGASDYVIKSASAEFFDLLRSAVTQSIERDTLRREKERAEVEMRQARARAEMLLHEVNHRISNSLSLVSTFVRLQRSAIANDEARAVLTETENRIFAVAQVHRSLYTTGDIGSIAMKDYLGQLASELEASLANEQAPHVIEVDADPVSIPTDKAVPIGIAVTELVTNAFKYAYAPGTAGRVKVILKAIGEKLRLSVEDEGVGISGAAKGTGLGTKIVKAMAADLGAELAVQAKSPGTRTTLSFQA